MPAPVCARAPDMSARAPGRSYRPSIYRGREPHRHPPRPAPPRHPAPSFAAFGGIASAQEYPPPKQYPAQSYPEYNGPAPQFYPEQLDNLVARIALYPDPLLAEVLTAATYPDQIPEAASWANQHRYLAG